MAESQLDDLLSQYVNSYVVDMSSLRTLMEAVAPDRRYEVVSSVRFLKEGTIAHRAVLKHDTEVVRCVMELLTEDENCKLMVKQDELGYTVIHYAVFGTSLRGLEMLKCLLESSKIEKRYQMLKIQDDIGNTPIHCAARGGYTETIKYLLDLLPPDKQIQLLDLQDENNNTTLDEAKLKNYTATVECPRLYRLNAEAHLNQVQERQREINIGNESPTSVQLARQAELIHEQSQQIRTLKRQASEHNKDQKKKFKKSRQEVAGLRRKFNEQQNETTKFRQESKQEIAELKETVAALQEVMTQSVSQSAAGPSFSNHLTEVGEVKKVMVDVERQDVRIGELEEQTRAANVFQGERLQEIADQLADHAEGIDDLADQLEDHAERLENLENFTHQMADHEQRIENSEDRLLLLEGHNQP